MDSDRKFILLLLGLGVALILLSTLISALVLP